MRRVGRLKQNTGRRLDFVAGRCGLLAAACSPRPIITPFAREGLDVMRCRRAFGLGSLPLLRVSHYGIPRAITAAGLRRDLTGLPPF